MASVLQGLQSSLTQLVEVSKAQTEVFNSLLLRRLTHVNEMYLILSVCVPNLASLCTL